MALFPRSKGRGFKFTVAKIEHLLKAIDEVVPKGNPDWERIWQEHLSRYLTKEQTTELLKCILQEFSRRKVPTGDPNCPPYIHDAKQIFYKIIQATDGSTGGSDGDFDKNGGLNERHGGGDDDDDDDVARGDDEENEEESRSVHYQAALLPRFNSSNSFYADNCEPSYSAPASVCGDGSR
jgi:hypothetical protein